ncbi:MAG: hypothetical protein ABIH39_05255 [Candidatus Margulisiibacteriota bacterium]
MKCPMDELKRRVCLFDTKLNNGYSVKNVLFSGFRGGNWNNDTTNARVSDRNNAANTNTNRNNNNGFRCAKTSLYTDI